MTGPMPDPYAAPYTQDDVDLVAAAICKASGGVYDNTSGWAVYVLDALAAAGRLLPRSSTGHQWGVRVEWVQETFEFPMASREDAEEYIQRMSSPSNRSIYKIIARPMGLWVEVTE